MASPFKDAAIAVAKRMGKAVKDRMLVGSHYEHYLPTRTWRTPAPAYVIFTHSFPSFIISVSLFVDVACISE
jgi:hypothetical protein